MLCWQQFSIFIFLKPFPPKKRVSPRCSTSSLLNLSNEMKHEKRIKTTYIRQDKKGKPHKIRS